MKKEVHGDLMVESVCTNEERGARGFDGRGRVYEKRHLGAPGKSTSFADLSFSSLINISIVFFVVYHATIKLYRDNPYF